jgi:spore germination protein KA
MFVLTARLDENVREIRRLFKDDKTLITRYVQNQTNGALKCCIVYIDGMIDAKLLDKDVIEPITQHQFRRMPYKKTKLIDVLAEQVLLSACIEKTSDSNTIIQSVLCGDSLLLIEGCADALLLNTKGWVKRGIEEPESEVVFKGPREGFNESIIVNLSLIRRKLRTQDLVLKFRDFGDRTHTKGCICYIEGVADPQIIAELEKRLDTFEIDGVLDVNYISEFITDKPYALFQTLNSSERPDVIAAKLLEGRIALFLDGTPVVLTLPQLFIENFQSNDYYLSYMFASIGRFVRLLGFVISVSIPAIYIALTCFHHELLPIPLIMSIAVARQSVPLPTIVEMFVMLIMFEILRETGSRIPTSMGQSLSIVGALVIGQAAVDAKLISAPIIVIVSTSAITGLLVPKIKGGIIIIRVLLLIASSFFGLYGYIFGMMGLLIYLIHMDSFGVPVLSSSSSDSYFKQKDTGFRPPWKKMRSRPKKISADTVRINMHEKKNKSKKKRCFFPLPVFCVVFLVRMLNSGN